MSDVPSPFEGWLWAAAERPHSFHCAHPVPPHIRLMPWDLRGSLLKKEERESARLADFEFKLRARTFRLVAEALETAPDEIVSLIAAGDDAAVLARLSERFPDRSADLDQLYARGRSTARAQLLAEEGDPSPHRLA